MDCSELSSESPYELLLKAAFLVPIPHYFFGFLFLLSLFLYHFLEIHFLQDLFTGFRGQPVELTFNSCSDLYQEVISKCKTLHGRFSSTPWLSSPHFQIMFLQFFGRAPVCNYRRQILHAKDGGTIALDWLRNVDVKNPSRDGLDGVKSDNKSPIMVVVTGLTSDSDSAYVKHLAFKIAHRRWNVVVMHYRGIGGVSITSDRIFNTQWIMDVAEVIDHLHTEYPQSPLYAVGTSVGANVLVGYLGGEGVTVNTALVGAAAICCPWDILMCDRFLHRRIIQRFYNKVLAIGLKDYAQLHQTTFSRLTDWERVAKTCSVRDFDSHATCVLTEYGTVDAYYRKSCTARFVTNVTVPLLCISTLDDPVCTREAIPWDECRVSKNVVLATTHHGGHLAWFEGMTAKSLWWVRAVDEYLCTLNSSPLIHREKIQNTDSTLKSSIDQLSPCHVNLREDSLVTALSKEPSRKVGNTPQNEQLAEDDQAGDPCRGVNGTAQHKTSQFDLNFDAMIDSVKACLNRQLSRRNKISMWMLACAAIITTWPILGSLFFKKKRRNIFSLPSLKR